VDAWFAAGRALGESEHQKALLEREREVAAASLVKGADVLRARQRWVRVARALVDDVEAEELPADVAERIVGGLKRALERAATAHDAVQASEDVTEDAETPEAKPVVVTPAAPANDTAPAERKTG
jgi:hypothetical protein